MRKSIFGYLVVSCLSVITIVGLIMMVYFFVFVEQYAIEEKAGILRESADELEEAIYVATRNQSETTDILFHNIIDTVSINTKSRVTVFDGNGVVIAASQDDTNEFQMVEFAAE